MVISSHEYFELLFRPIRLPKHLFDPVDHLSLLLIPISLEKASQIKPKGKMSNKAYS